MIEPFTFMLYAKKMRMEQGKNNLSGKDVSGIYTHKGRSRNAPNESRCNNTRNFFKTSRKKHFQPSSDWGLVFEILNFDK